MHVEVAGTLTGFEDIPDSNDLEFRRHGQCLEEVGAGITTVTRAGWFLEKSFVVR